MLKLEETVLKQKIAKTNPNVCHHYIAFMCEFNKGNDVKSLNGYTTIGCPECRGENNKCDQYLKYDEIK